MTAHVTCVDVVLFVACGARAWWRGEGLGGRGGACAVTQRAHFNVVCSALEKEPDNPVVLDAIGEIQLEYFGNPVAAHEVTCHAWCCGRWVHGVTCGVGVEPGTLFRRSQKALLSHLTRRLESGCTSVSWWMVPTRWRRSPRALRCLLRRQRRVT